MKSIAHTTRNDFQWLAKSDQEPLLPLTEEIQPQDTSNPPQALVIEG